MCLTASDEHTFFFTGYIFHLESMLILFIYEKEDEASNICGFPLWVKKVQLDLGSAGHPVPGFPPGTSVSPHSPKAWHLASLVILNPA